MIIFEYLLSFDSEKLKRSRGLYTDQQVSRCCQLGGQFGKDLDAMLLQNIGMVHSTSSTLSHHVKCSDVRAFIERYESCNLWKSIPGRAHVGFEKMKHEFKVRNCEKFARRLSHLSYRLDVWKKFAK